MSLWPGNKAAIDGIRATSLWPANQASVEGIKASVASGAGEAASAGASTASGATAAAAGVPILGIGIAAAASLIGSLMGNADANERARQERLQKASDQGFESQRNAAAAIGASDQNAFGQMMQGYRSALIR